MVNLFEHVAQLSIRQNSRNTIVNVSEALELLNMLPNPLKVCYEHVAPIECYVSVQKGLNLEIVGLPSINEVQNQYNCHPYFVFAILEGDPIALYNGKVWIAEHAVGNWKFNLLANSINDFWKQLIKDLD